MDLTGPTRDVDDTAGMLDTVVSDLEPCPAFAAGPDGTPVCSTCGWLEDEHDVTVRTVIDLRGRGRHRGAGDVRLAS